MPSDPRRVRAVFNAANDIADEAERLAFLDRECGDDRELRISVDELLAVMNRSAGSQRRPLAASTEMTALVHEEPEPKAAAPEPSVATEKTASFQPEHAALAPLIGSVIAGRYKLRQEIGEGGMGSVYLAEQTQPVKRQVALKLIKAGHGLEDGPRPVRVGAAGPGADGPPATSPGCSTPARPTAAGRSSSWSWSRASRSPTTATSTGSASPSG